MAGMRVRNIISIVPLDIHINIPKHSKQQKHITMLLNQLSIHTDQQSSKWLITVTIYKQNDRTREHYATDADVTKRLQLPLETKRLG